MYNQKQIIWNSNLENKINSIPQYYIRSTPQDQTSESYARMKKLAIEEDDFRKVVDVFASVLKSSVDVSQATEVLREAYRMYIDTQKRLANLFGGQGQFDYVEEHLRNAHFGCELSLGIYRNIRLTTQIRDDEVRMIIDNAIKNTEPAYFFQRALKTSENGDLEGLEKYISLSMQCLNKRGLIEIPEIKNMFSSEPIDSIKYERFIRMRMGLGRLYKKAYGIAVRKKIEIAIGHAVFSDNECIKPGKYNIRQLEEEIKDLMMNAVGKMIPDSKVAEAFRTTVCFFNEFLNPFFEELLVCYDDPKHPLRSLFKPFYSKMYRNSMGYSVYEAKITGFERVKVDCTDIVPRKFYCGLFLHDGIPVHPFFNLTLERYA
jgi:hypothetical protein